MPHCTAIIHIQLDCDNPEEMADMAARELIDSGFDATLDDVVEHTIDMAPDASHLVRVEGSIDGISDLLGEAVGREIESYEILTPKPKPKAEVLYHQFVFRCDALEGGHGQDFRACFCCRRLHPEASADHGYCVESVDVMCEAGVHGWCGIGGVGGELVLDCPLNSDGSENIEQMCRDWVGKWHRRFHGETEDSVAGMYRIIKQIVADGRPDNA